MSSFHWQPRGTRLSHCLHNFWYIMWFDLEHKLFLSSFTCSHPSAVNLGYIFSKPLCISVMDEGQISSCVSLWGKFSFFISTIFFIITVIVFVFWMEIMQNKKLSEAFILPISTITKAAIQMKQFLFVVILCKSISAPCTINKLAKTCFVND